MNETLDAMSTIREVGTNGEAEPVLRVTRNSSGQIHLTDAKGDAFDMSKYVGAEFYLHPATLSPTVREAEVLHLKTGNHYTLLGEAIDATNARAGNRGMVYRKHGQLFFRDTPEFSEKFRVITDSSTSPSSREGEFVVPDGCQLVPKPVTEEMHMAACKVLLRASGLDGLPQRMLSAMLAVAPRATHSPQGGTSMVSAQDLFNAPRIMSSTPKGQTAGKTERTIALPDGLHPDTADLVARFATALAEKLYKAEQKYGYSSDWLDQDWMVECQGKLAEHVEKGDPRDVAAYCAFMWHHGWQTGGPRSRKETSTDTQTRKGIYFASKVKHADTWKRVRDAGVLTVSTWIDEAGEGQTADYAELSDRCVAEISRASAVLLYCEPGEVLKGALIEVGVALAVGTPVLCVGECESLSRVFRKHPLWQEFSTVDEALEAAWKLRKQASPRNHFISPVPDGQELRDAAQAVIDRWDSPKWKDLPATGEFIGRLRKAVAAFDEVKTESQCRTT